MRRKTVSVFLIFLVMGFGDLIGPLVSLVKQKLSLTQFEASFIAFVGFIMFGTLSIPTGYFQEKYGRRVTAVVGLMLVLTGLMVPVLGMTRYAMFLTAVSLIGAGAAVLQVAGAPLLHGLSAPGDFARNLTFGQFIKGIGTLSAPLIPFLAIRYFSGRWEIVFTIFAIGTVITLAVFLFTTWRGTPDGGNSHKATLSGSFQLLADKKTALMVLGIFLYVGAEVCMSATLPALLQNQSGIVATDIGMAGVGLFFLTLMVGRFAGTLVLKWITPAHFYLYTTLLSIAGIVLLALSTGVLGFIAACIIGLGFANIFPLIFSLTIESRPSRANELSGLMVSAIAGGAIIPLAMGYASDHSSARISLAVPLLCLVYLAVTAFRAARGGRVAA